MLSPHYEFKGSLLRNILENDKGNKYSLGDKNKQELNSSIDIQMQEENEAENAEKLK